ncbi:MAG: hypothetical protein PHH54_07265 [Candidatus Nanoarchaeia archaeon]|nr:hypothetical protein [Candidatus Nanoarchaeia archaeon]MDD5741755.1 hypothetical protein [Candidatus Nanoarchaeia archaeon]
MGNVSHHYFFREDTVIIKKPNSCLSPEGKRYYLSEPMRSTGDGTFEQCGGTVHDSLEEMANGVIIGLFANYGEGYVREQVILYNSLNNEVKGKPCVLIDRESVVVKGASSDIDDLLKLQKILKEKISKRLQQH